MLQIQRIRQQPKAIIEGLKKRGIDAAQTVNDLIDLDAQRRGIRHQMEEKQARSNALAKEIGQLFKSGKGEEANELKAETGTLKQDIKVLNEELQGLEEKEHDLILTLPNVPHESVPAGKDENDNEEVGRKGEIPTLHEGAKPHWDLASEYNLIDFELGVKISGAGFPVYVNHGARLQRAMINFFLDENRAAGYTEYQPPHFVNAASGYGTGQLPDKEGQMYEMPLDGLYAIPTAEVPITNIFRDEIVKAADFPIKSTGYTPCFRREAGSYGKDVRGLNRLHQFDKVEIVSITDPESSYALLDEMVAHVASLLDKLELPYRILRLCGGDAGFTSALTYDFEVYSAAQERWLEVSSVSNFETFQANRLKLRYRDENGKTQLCHTLNGSAMALPRVLAALLENHQTPEGIKIPEALVSYTGFDIIK
ncbi:MAG: Serine--tRNA ligase [Cryomorphaceae bacterium]|nr:serine--tRNA ligase [Cryomorphaceae bacterium]CAI8173063.1 MAG: Serine--tRNA ligase [Cryomorphaceae bacterium]